MSARRRGTRDLPDPAEEGDDAAEAGQQAARSDDADSDPSDAEFVEDEPLETSDTGNGGAEYSDEESEQHEPSLTLQDDLAQMSVEDRQETINEEHPFGIPIWKPALHAKHRSIDDVAEIDLHAEPPADAAAVTPMRLHLPNLLWTLTLGWLLALIFIAASVLASFASVAALAVELKERSVALGVFAANLRELSAYILSPFGWYIVRIVPMEDRDVDPLSAAVEDNSTPLLRFTQATNVSVPALAFRKSMRFILVFTAMPMLFAAAAMCWFFILPIPMARFLYHLARELWFDPVSLRVRAPGVEAKGTTIKQQGTSRRPSHEETVVPIVGQAETAEAAENEVLLLSIHKSTSYKYVKYTVGGINVMIVNSLALPLITTFLTLLPTTIDPSVLFALALLSIVPCAYFIGAAVSAITNLTGNLALGAVLNATFGSIVEILIYVGMIRQGGKSKLVEGSLIGSFLFGMLCMPGLAMFFGGLSRRSMSFNVRATGVTVTLLILSVIGVLVPTLFHNTFAPWDLYCDTCARNDKLPRLDTMRSPDSCEMSRCWMKQPAGGSSPLFASNTRPLMFFCAGILVLTYGIGIFYTLRTHRKHIYKKGAKGKRGKRAGGKNKETKDSIVAPTASSSTPRLGWNSPRFGGERSATLRRLRGLDSTRSPQLNGRPSASTIQPLRPAQLLMGDLAATSASTSKPSRAEESPALPTPTTSVPADQVSLSSSSAGSAPSEGAGHGGPAWNLGRSVVVLLLSTVLFSLVAEVLVNNVDGVLDSGEGGLHLDQKILGLVSTWA